MSRLVPAVSAAAGAAALALYAATAAPSITWRNGGTDSGELATAVATGSVAHPPGYPTYLLLGRVAALLPVEPARALTWLSAVCAALACAAVVSGALRSGGVRGVAGQLAALGPALWLATSWLLWASATYAEVNAPMTAAAAVWLAARGWAARRPRALFALGLALGAALGIHVLLVFLAGATAFGQLGAAQAWRRLAALACGVGIGALAAFGSLALYPAAGPVNWYAPQTLEGWLLLVSADAYRGLLDLPGAPVRLAAALRTLIANLGPVGAVVTAAGLQEVLAQRRRGGTGGTLRCAGAALVYLVFTALYGARDADAYLLPALVLLAPAGAAGIRAAAVLVADLVHRAPRRAGPRLAPVLLAALVLGQPVVQVVRLMPALDLRADRVATAYAARVLDDAPPGALLVSGGDAATFALWYARYALGRRPDVAVVNDDLLVHAWYREHVARVHADLVVPPVDGGAAALDAALAAVNPGRVRRTPAPPFDAGDGPRT